MKILTNIIKDFKELLRDKTKKSICDTFIAFAFLFCVIAVFNIALGVGFLLLLLLTAGTFFVMYRNGVKDKNIYIVFLIAVVLHLAMVMIIYYGHFKPFGGGADFEGYNQTAIEIADRFWHGNFSLEGLYTDHLFPIIMGIVYMVTFPDMFVGQSFVVWLSGLTAILVYLISLEIGGTKKTAFLASAIIAFYPSYLYFGSILLKDTLVIPFVLAGILLILKMCKNFSWQKFLFFFVLLTCLINLRFYIGYALMFTLILSWPLLSTFVFKKKMIYWAVIILLLGFSPQILGDRYVGNGYYGFKSFKKLLNPEKITYYREVLYSNPEPSTPEPTQPVIIEPTPQTPSPPVTPEPTVIEPAPVQGAPLAPETNGTGSTFSVKTGLTEGMFTFFKNSLQSFIHALLGPFPWQFTKTSQVASLAETIPWYILILVWIYGSIKFIAHESIKSFWKLHRLSFPLIVFSILALGALSLYINNYGIIARIRIPAFISLVVVMCIVVGPIIENHYEKVSHYWRRWIHRLPFSRGAEKSGQ